MEIEKGTYRYSKTSNQKDTYDQSTLPCSPSFSSDTYNNTHNYENTLQIRTSDKLPSPSSSKKVLDIQFLLCSSCFWCASFTGIHKRMITQCPSCNSVRLESMPISEKEAYRFDYYSKRGITLEFSNTCL